MTNLLASVAHLVDIEVFVPAEMTVAGSTLTILRLESLRVSTSGFRCPSFRLPVSILPVGIAPESFRFHSITKNPEKILKKSLKL